MLAGPGGEKAGALRPVRLERVHALDSVTHVFGRMFPNKCVFPKQSILGAKGRAMCLRWGCSASLNTLRKVTGLQLHEPCAISSA